MSGEADVHLLRSLGWFGIIATAALLAGAGGWALRGMGSAPRAVGCAALAAVASLGWFTVVQPLLYRPSGVTVALGVSLSVNIGLAAWVGASAGSHDARARWESRTHRPVESR